MDWSIRLVLGNLAAWTHASAIVYASEVYDPRKILIALEEEQCTGVHGVPTHFLGLLAEFEKDKRQGVHRKLDRLRFDISYGGFTLDPNASLSPRLGLELRQAPLCLLTL